MSKTESSKAFQPVNSKSPHCVDGRKAAFYAEQVNGEWQLVSRGAEAEAENGPQFLGASLLFVKVLEVFQGLEDGSGQASEQGLETPILVEQDLSRGEIFDLVEEVHGELSLIPQVHIDDKHGEYDFDAMSDEEILAFVTAYEQLTGCGFAKFAWGEEGVEYIREALKRGWRLQGLMDAHEERGGLH